MLGKIALTKWLKEYNGITNYPEQRGLVQGVGVNNADYLIRKDGFLCPAYEAWSGILERAYSKEWHRKHPAYKGVTVCKEWHNFMTFRAWWLDAYEEGWELDKDILSNNKEYSPETCLYVPKWVNRFAPTIAKKGVRFNKQRQKFEAYCRVEGRNKYLGLFSSEAEAKAKRKEEKEKVINNLRSELDAIDARLFDALLRKLE